MTKVFGKTQFCHVLLFAFIPTALFGAIMGSSYPAAIAQDVPPPPPPPPPPGVDGESDGNFDPPGSSDSSEPSTGGESSSPPPTPTKQPSASASKAPSKKIPPGQDLVSIDFPEPTPIKDIIKAVSQWTGRNFILGSNVSSNAKVAIISPQQVTKEEAYQAFLSALNVAGFTTVDAGKVVKIIGSRQASSSSIKTFYGASWALMTDEIITQIIPLAYIDAQTVSTQLRSILRDSNPVPFQTTNSLIVTDTGNKIRRLLEIIRLLDVKGNQPQVAILAVKHTDANDIGKKIQDVFGARGGGAALYLQKVIVDERTNSLILIGPPRGLDDVVRLINRLDKPLDDASAQNQIHVRPLDYADSEKLSATLQALAQGQAAARRRPPNAPPIQNLGSQSADIGGVKITSDKSTNSLIVQGSNAQFKEIDTIIRQLDKRRDQVYVEADVLDVNVGNDLQLATSFIAGASAANGRANVPFGWKSGNIAPFIVNRDNPTDADKSLLLSAIPTSAYIGALSTSKIKIGGIELSPGAFIFALKQDSNSNVLQTPSLLVADNEEANFDATEREYLLTSTEDPVSKTRSQKLENLDASLGIKIKPQVSKADFVSMDITIKAESFGTRDSDNKPKQINKRSVQTKITTQNGQTIVISGLQRDIEIESKSKVPLLGDLPIIGWLFRNLNTVKNKTSLMVFLTPHVIRSSEDLAKIYERKVRERDEFLKAFYGEDFRKRPVFKRMSRLEDGKVPPPRADLVTPADAPTVGPTAPADANHKLPSEDPNPIVVPSSGAMGAPVFSGGGDIGGGAVPPPPPPPPAPADGQ